MKKFRKKEMTKFDYKMRIFVIFSVLIFAATAVFAYPNINSNESKNEEIQQQIKQTQVEIDTANQQLDEILEDNKVELTK